MKTVLVFAYTRTDHEDVVQFIAKRRVRRVPKEGGSFILGGRTTQYINADWRLRAERHELTVFELEPPGPVCNLWTVHCQL